MLVLYVANCFYKPRFSDSTACHMLVYSTMLFQGLDPVEAVKSIAMLVTESRFVELSHAHTDRMDVEQFRHCMPKLFDMVRDFDIALKIIHMPTYLSRVESIDDVEKIVTQASKWLDAAYFLGINTAVIHTLYTVKQVSTYTPEWFNKNIELNRKFIHKLGQKARELGIVLAIENRVERWLVGNTATELVKIIHGFDGVGVCFDLGHAHASGYDPAEFHEMVREYIVAYHVHDNDGTRDQHLLPLLGTINWNAVRNIMDRSKPMVFEVACISGRLCGNYVKLISVIYRNIFGDELTAS